MKALVFNNKVVQLSENSFPVTPTCTWVDDVADTVDTGFIYDPSDDSFSKPDGYDDRNDLNNTPGS
jgi:hypothetical protein